MRKNRLLENLNQSIVGSNIPMKRYSLADMISESYKMIYQCNEGTNLKKLAESHLDDVRQNPKDIERLSRQLSILKELGRMVESNDLKDEDLVDEKYHDTVEPKEDRVIVQNECNESDDPKIQERSLRKLRRHMVTQEACQSKEESIKEAEDPDLTDEELEELAKHLETIRKERKDAPKTEMKEDATPTRRGIRCHISDAKKPRKEDIHEASTPEQWVTQYGVDILTEDGQSDIDYKIEYALTKAGLKVLGIQPTDASWSVSEYEKLTGISVGDILGESKKLKGKRLKESVFTGADSLADKIESIVREIVEQSEKDYGIPDDGFVPMKELTSDLNPEYYGMWVDFQSKSDCSKAIRRVSSELPQVKSLSRGNTGSSGIWNGDNFSVIFYVTNMNESKSYRGLANFRKQSESKAFYKTFKKMHESLKEGKALTRQESIDLYKASNSALTQLSIELEHNPEFLDTFKESVSLLSKDVSSLLESLTRGKAPSKATMKSLAKFSEALLCEEDHPEYLADFEVVDTKKVGNYEIQTCTFSDHEGYGVQVVDSEGNPLDTDEEINDLTFDKFFKDKKDADTIVDKLVTILSRKYPVDESVKYPNGSDVTDIDLNKALDYQYGEDRDKDNSKYTDVEKQKAVLYWLKKTDPEPELNESDDDFIGDDEGDMQSEEADAFDQEYADARVELHKDLEDKHADDDDPVVQEKLAQDAEEVTNLPGVTEEQIAEINGEESTEEPEGDDIEDKPEESEDDSEITDDELEELKKHLKEMRSIKK